MLYIYTFTIWTQSKIYYPYYSFMYTNLSTPDYPQRKIHLFSWLFVQDHTSASRLEVNTIYLSKVALEFVAESSIVCHIYGMFTNALHPIPPLHCRHNNNSSSLLAQKTVMYFRKEITLLYQTKMPTINTKNGLCIAFATVE